MLILQQAYSLDRPPQKIHGTLRFGVLESLLFARMVQLFSQYQKLFPNVEIQVVEGTAFDLYQQLSSNQIDMAYLTQDLNCDPDLVCAYQRKEEIVCVASPQHPLVCHSKITLAEFLSYPLVVTERTGVVYSRLKALAAAKQLIPNNALVVNNTKAITEILKHGGGLSFLPRYSIEEELLQKALVQLPVDIPSQIYYSQVLYHRKKWIAPFMSGLVDLIRSNWPET